MTAQLIFDMTDPNDREQHKMAVHASDMAITLSEIRQRMWRPSRKHGYDNPYLNKIDEDNPELFLALEEMFNDICKEYGVIEWT